MTAPYRRHRRARMHGRITALGAARQFHHGTRAAPRKCGECRAGFNRRSLQADSGATLVEMLIALALMLVVTVIVFGVVNSAEDTSLAQPVAIDMAQRARVGADMLVRDLVMAGAGLDSGPAVGPLGGFIAPVVPRRTGLMNADPATVARDDAISIFYVPDTPVQTTATSFVSGALQLRVAGAAGCPIGLPACGITTNTPLLIFDALGHADAFTATDVQDDVVQLAHHASDATWAYAAGSPVTGISTHVYYLDTAHAQLRHYDGYRTDAPVIDNVVGLTFAYLGDPNSPIAPKPPPGTANCLYDAAGSLVPLPTLGAGMSLVALPMAMLHDGPWCGSGSGQFDADLLRVRVVRVTIRVQAASAALRGVGAAFANAGSSHGSYRALPDGVFTFDVSPANLTLGAWK
jgi:hypothetical protein